MRLPALFLICCFFTSVSLAQHNGGDGAYLILPPSEINRIHGVIGGQVAAFRQGDMARAFSYAAPDIQRTFGDPDRFGTMVAQGYGPIFAAFRFEFIALIGTRDQPIQVVNFVGEDLTSVTALYLMELQPDGQWRIAGVQITPTSQQAI